MHPPLVSTPQGEPSRRNLIKFSEGAFLHPLDHRDRDGRLSPSDQEEALTPGSRLPRRPSGLPSTTSSSRVVDDHHPVQVERPRPQVGVAGLGVRLERDIKDGADAFDRGEVRRCEVTSCGSQALLVRVAPRSRSMASSSRRRTRSFARVIAPRAEPRAPSPVPRAPSLAGRAPAALGVSPSKRMPRSSAGRRRSVARASRSSVRRPCSVSCRQRSGRRRPRSSQRKPRSSRRGPRSGFRGPQVMEKTSGSGKAAEPAHRTRFGVFAQLGLGGSPGFTEPPALSPPARGEVSSSSFCVARSARSFWKSLSLVPRTAARETR